MTKFYEVSKVLDKRTYANGRVQFLVRWRGYGKRYDSWVDEHNTNERLRQVYLTRHQGNPGLLQTLAVLIAEKLNMKKPPTTSIVRRASVTMPMDSKTFRELFSGLPSAPNLLQVTKFSVPVHELDTIMPPGWSLNAFKTSTTCRLQPGKPVEIALLERKKVFYDHSKCLRCKGGDGAPVACKDVVRKIIYRSTLIKGLSLPRTKQACPEKPAQGAHKVNVGKTQTCPQRSTVSYRWVVTTKTAPLGATT